MASYYLSLFSGNPMAVLRENFKSALPRRIPYRFKSFDDRNHFRAMHITHAVAYQRLREDHLSRSRVVDNTSLHLIRTPSTYALVYTGDAPVVRLLELALLMLVDEPTASHY
jgi:hypothetical protein